ncbi:hypothetical protein CK203_078808 [Vitis vinifera]|uniref:Uncharacterized protein n=1 Tax=Vitis vinifera TaxID=29760 RepID=A0A438F7H9_VITVI|nr:hypothetical protein CK203_078808 [Vitis vinifera]
MRHVAELVPRHPGRVKKQEPASTSNTGSSKSGKGGKKKRGSMFTGAPFPALNFTDRKHDSGMSIHGMAFQARDVFTIWGILPLLRTRELHDQ